MKKKRIYNTLIKNYIIFISSMLLICIVSFILLSVLMSKSVTEQKLPAITADAIVKGNYKDIDISDIRLLDGWVEILDENNRVIHTIGNKKTAAMVYQTADLINLFSYPDNHEYVYTGAAFTEPNSQKEYICLVALPQSKIDITMNIVNAPFELTKIYFGNMLKAAIFFLILFVLNIFLYSKWTARRISAPLTRITSSIQRMSDGDLSTRMDFKAENEFLQIRDAFNQMADNLQKAQQDNRRLEEERNRMFMDISHDLKTPITTIQGYALALKEGMVEQEEKKQRYLQTIFDKSVRVTNLINNVFDLAKLENTTPQFQIQNHDLAEFLRKMAAEFYEQIEQKGMVLDFNTTVNKLDVPFDMKEMERVIANLLSNSILYNQSGTTIKMSLFEQDDTAIIEIADNGTGIPDELKDIIFSPFVRGDASRSSEGGTGLGLAIAKKIVEGHGGRLELVNDKDEYKTVFRIFLVRGE
ncbi:MAG: HAMP domain-containing histidine kinase [Leptolinea sp.]|nr:HAMP domain-containing histidine kinase [Leptolinea sp.]